VSVTSAS